MDGITAFLVVAAFICADLQANAVTRTDFQNYGPFLSKRDASMFVRETRSVDCTREGACERNPDECTTEPMREQQCRGHLCPSGQVCYMTTPCPAHYRMDCKDDACTEARPCKNGATCVTQANYYKCICTPGWTGKNCEIKIDLCQSATCHHGTCTTKVINYECTCAPGYIGKQCEIAINECKSAPCQHGRCLNLVNDYLCLCFAGYNGKNCENDINECLGAPCQHGTCIDRIDYYTCQCTPGYSGRNCEIDIDDCQGNPCKHGTCFDRVNDYKCHCTTEYSGKNCEIDINKCRSSPCQYGICTNKANGYTCKCPPGYTGRNCEIDIDDCQGDPCQHGTCIDRVNDYRCLCTPGYTGKNCEIDIDECKSDPCQHGTCTDQINNYTCTCEEDFIGRNCEIDTCDTKYSSGAELVFVIDSSVSKGNSSFQRQKQYVKDFVAQFDIGPTKFQVAIITFAFKPEVRCFLNTYTSLPALNNAIDNLVFTGGPSYTGTALKTVREKVLTLDTGMRSMVPKFVLVLTDGLSSNIGDTKLEADKLKNIGAKVVTVAIGSQINHQELLNISSATQGIPLVFPSTSKDALYSILKDRLPKCPDCFHNSSDVVILFDMSDDIPPEEFYPAFGTLKSLVEILPINQNKIHLQYIKYAGDVVEVFDWTHPQTHENIIPAIVSDVTRLKGPANLSKALEYVFKNGFSVAKGARSNARKFTIVFSQGNFNNVVTSRQTAAVLKGSGVMVATIGIGFQANMVNLLSIASDPALTYLVGEDLDINDKVLQALCGTLEFDVCEFD